ncbi:hypothetical protein [Pseudonocardia sp. ICBG601]|uniref:hypothetical protein n=1 Tax=Pseudonocardia sp. ICBG601 TaxID=2846759 RepID=UPI001CF6296F|nr:hypothetical protein [Pseudonocardia sp. ICBG601]
MPVPLGDDLVAGPGDQRALGDEVGGGRVSTERVSMSVRQSPRPIAIVQADSARAESGSPSVIR